MPLATDATAQQNRPVARNSGLTIGIDVGTSSVAVAAWDAGARRVETAVTVENDAALTAGADRFEQDPRRIWSAVSHALQSVAAAVGGRADAVSCTGQMHGVLLVDDRLDPVSPLVTWQDRRSAKQAVEGNAALDRGDPRGPRGRGCRLPPGYGAATLSWLQANGGLPAGARWACTIADWTAARLCGRLGTDPSNAAAWGIASVSLRDWDREAIRILGLPEAILPPVREPGSLLGHADLGALGSRVPVACGLGDNQASVFAAVSANVLAALRGASEDDCCVANVGTGSQLSMVAAGGTALDEAWGPGLEVRPYLDGRSLCVGASLNGGAAYALLRRLVSELRGQASVDEDLYEVMERWAGAVPPGCDGLVCEPAFFGERGREGLSGSFAGISAANLTPGHLCRAVLEGMARTLHGFSIAVGIPAGTLVGSGNAVRKSALFRTILASTFGIPLEVSPYTEEAAVGAALVAARLL